MKLKLIATYCCLVLFAFGCRKKEKPIESTWTWNGEKHTGVARATIGKAIAMLGNNNTKDGFKMVFALPYLPLGDDQKQWTIGMDNNRGPNIARLFFYLNGIGYEISSCNTIPLIASNNNGKAKYELEGAWFLNDFQDSVFITAVLNEP